MCKKLCLLLVTCFFASCSVADGNLVNIKGSVVHHYSGESLPGVEVSIYEFPKWNSLTSAYKPLSTVFTDENGRTIPVRSQIRNKFGNR